MKMCCYIWHCNYCKSCHLERLTCSVIVAVIQMTAAQHKPAQFKFQILFSGTNSIATLLTEH